MVCASVTLGLTECPLCCNKTPNELADETADESLSAPNMRKPLTGHLTMRIHAVKDVDHAASSRFSRGPETFVVVKVEDAIKARTKATRTDRWPEEPFNIDIDKANEIELTVYDKSGDRPTPIGMLWIRITDIAEEMRRKKLETEFNASGWVSADKMEHGGTPGHPTQPSVPGYPPNSGAPGQPGPGAAAGGGPVLIDSWFALEPVGRIHLTMSFGEPSRPSRGPSIRSANACLCSQTNEGSPSVRYRSQPTRCRPPKEGRGTREAGPQIHHPAILQYHALCAVWGLFEVLRRHAVRRLQIHLSSQVLLQGGHQVHQQGEL